MFAHAMFLKFEEQLMARARVNMQPQRTGSRVDVDMNPTRMVIGVTLNPETVLLQSARQVFGKHSQEFRSIANGIARLRRQRKEREQLTTARQRRPRRRRFGH
jgi:hypothetical protein